MDKTLGKLYWEELKDEAVATRKCLERIPLELSAWKPHDKSMPLGYLALVVSEIPRWISHAIKEGDIDFATFKHFQPKTTEELVKHFDENMEGAKKALENVSDEALEESFSLKNNGQVLATDSKKHTVSSSINHLVHHRGQLTVYMRLNNIAVPSIYGPSADDKSF